MNKVKEIAAILLVVSSVVGCGLYTAEGESFSEIETTAQTTATRTAEITSLSTTSSRCGTSTTTTSTTKETTKLTTTVTTAAMTTSTTPKSITTTTITVEETEDVVQVEDDTSQTETDTTVDSEIVQEESTEPGTEDTYYITEYERELLAEVVEHEAGSDWIGCYDKACCVAAIMNRVRQGCWGGSDIYSVLSAPNQFSGFYPGYCTAREGAYEAVDYYFNNPGEFSTTITSWSGDGYRNYFY